MSMHRDPAQPIRTRILELGRDAAARCVHRITTQPATETAEMVKRLYASCGHDASVIMKPLGDAAIEAIVTGRMHPVVLTSCHSLSPPALQQVVAHACDPPQRRMTDDTAVGILTHGGIWSIQNQVVRVEEVAPQMLTWLTAQAMRLADDQVTTGSQAYQISMPAITIAINAFDASGDATTAETAQVRAERLRPLLRLPPFPSSNTLMSDVAARVLAHDPYDAVALERVTELAAETTNTVWDKPSGRRIMATILATHTNTDAPREQMLGVWANHMHLDEVPLMTADEVQTICASTTGYLTTAVNQRWSGSPPWFGVIAAAAQLPAPEVTDDDKKSAFMSLLARQRNGKPWRTWLRRGLGDDKACSLILLAVMRMADRPEAQQHLGATIAFLQREIAEDPTPPRTDQRITITMP